MKRLHAVIAALCVISWAAVLSCLRSDREFGIFMLGSTIVLTAVHCIAVAVSEEKA